MSIRTITAQNLALALIIIWGLLHEAFAAPLLKEDIEQIMGFDYLVGDLQADLPIYPLYIPHGEGKPELKGYVFETNGLTSVRGYSGKPLSILVVMDLNGVFLDTILLDQREPLFVRDDAAARLHRYIKQHKGLSVHHVIEVGKANDTPSRTDQTAFLRGVHTGTITVKAITRTIMTSATTVALARLKQASAPADPVRPNAPAPTIAATEPQRPPPAPAPAVATVAVVTPADTSAMTPGASNSKPAPHDAAEHPTAGAGRAKFNDAAPSALRPTPAVPTSATRSPSAASDGRGEPLASSPGSAPGEVSAELPAASTLRVDAAHDPAASPEGPATQRSLGATDEPDWVAQWRARRTDIAVLAAGLLALTAGLLAQKRLSDTARRLRWFRTVYLIFTVGFIGWYAQGQLTIVNLVAATESLAGGDDLSFLMNDPMSVILWLFVAVSLLVWGRGTFCGWLCPFGALQELVSLIAQAAGLRSRRLKAALDARLKGIKYVVLATIMVSIFLAPDFATWAVEIEPFKTAISLYFVRSWPFVMWALACLALGVFVYRGYCRYICPLGAALATLGFLRRWAWIARRTSCGRPCQTCRHRCEFQAIDPAGQVNYRECFQCLDCVSIYQDDQHCLPLIQEKKRATRTITVTPVAGIAR